MQNLAQAFKVHGKISSAMSTYNHEGIISKYLKDFCISNDLYHTAGNKQKTITYDDGSAMIIQHEHYDGLYHTKCDHSVYAINAHNQQTYIIDITDFELVEIIKSQ